MSPLNATDPAECPDAALAYALYVLARNGRPIIGDVRYLADAKLDTFKTPMAKAQIAAALALLGDRARSAKIFSAALDALDNEKDDGYSRPDYGSTLARRRGRARAARRGQSSPTANSPAIRSSAPARTSMRRATRAATSARRRTTG